MNLLKLIVQPCSRLLLIERLRGFLLPCPFKYLTGWDCPGCGFQRSVLALCQGNLHQSFLLYPPTIPLLAATAFTLAAYTFGIDKHHRIKKSLYVITGSFILVSYVFKLMHLYTVSA